MPVQWVQKAIYNNFVQRPCVAKKLDGLGRALNAAGLRYATGHARYKATLYASDDAAEVAAARTTLVETSQSKDLPNRVQKKAEWTIQFYDGKYKSKGDRYARRVFQEFQDEGRLSAEEIIAIRAELETDRAQEHLFGFGVFFSIKAVTEISGLILGLAGVAATASLWGAAPLAVLPVLVRTPFTVSRMIASRKNENLHWWHDYKRALLFGFLVTPGGLAGYPMQMMRKTPHVAQLLLTNLALGTSKRVCKYVLPWTKPVTREKIDNSFVDLTNFICLPASQTFDLFNQYVDDFFAPRPVLKRTLWLATLASFYTFL